MLILLFTITALLTPLDGFLQKPTAQSVKDTRGCVVPGEEPQNGIVIESTVPCVEGRNEGYGKVRWSRDGITTWQLTVSKTTGLVFKNGELRLEWDPAQVDLRVIKCESTGFADAVVIYPDELAVYLDWVAREVMHAAYMKLNEVCPMPRGSTYARDIKAYSAGGRSKEEPKTWGAGMFSCQIYGAYPKRLPSGEAERGCRLGVNFAAEAYTNQIHDIAKAERDRIEEERQRLAAASAASAERKRQEEIARRTSAFVNANGVKRFVQLEELSTNPFAYTGQTVAIVVGFEQMLSPSEALFSSGTTPLVVSAVPSARFTKARALVLVAGRVVGNKEVKLPLLGPTLAPHIAFVGSVFCQEKNCADYARVVK